MYSGLLKAPSRPHTPLSARLRGVGGAGGSQSGAPPAAEPDSNIEDDPQIQKFRQLYDQTESRIASLFDSVGDVIKSVKKLAIAPKSQNIDIEKSNKVQIIADVATSSPIARPVINSRRSSDSGRIPPKPLPPAKENPEDARKKLEAAKRLETETVKTMSRLMFFTLENDRDAMLDQQRLDEAERRAEAEAEGHASRQNAAAQQGSLSNTNLGASSLTLKNLIERIDNRRNNVNATDAEIRALLSEVRKNRSKWSNEDKVGQEELYDAAEKVLNELKAMTEHSAPFLNPVKKKDAPDYHHIIKNPMDLGTMTKKLKNFTYKSKREFVDDLYQIWKNCLKFNSSPDHIFRKHALYMQKETDKLAPLIPEIVIRDRAEIEAEERRQQIANGEIDDGAEESDDEPIMASRGRKAPKKSAQKGTSTARKSIPESTPLPDTKPVNTALNSVQDFRAESEIDGSQGHSTPPPGTLTPVGAGHGSVLGAGSEAPDMDLPALPTTQTAVPEYEDEDYKLWKQKTKKDRAMLAAARHKMFRGDKLNADEEALLRSKSGMRRWQRIQQEAAALDAAQEGDESRNKASTSLSEGLEAEEETMLPDYYDSLAAIPDLDPKLRWERDNTGQVVVQFEEYLRLFPEGQFKSPESTFAKRINANIAQMQDTKKIVSKIGVVKQMQLQTQTYQNQFSKYQPEPFHEQDIEKHVQSEDGPIMAPYVCKAALQRAVGKILFTAGFEEYQPGALDVMTDLAADFFRRLVSTIVTYKHQQAMPILPPAQSVVDPSKQRPTMTNEEIILLTLHDNGLSLTDLDLYVKEDTDRLSTKLTTMHERMKAHLADLLRPALNDDTAQGQGTFTDGGEQFVSGDFAEDLGEDFFGFRELGLVGELGLDSLTVPFHILHGRLNMAARQDASTSIIDGEKSFKDPPRWAKVNPDNVDEIVGIARGWFQKKVAENGGDRPLLEDYELPPKQRPGYGRPRVPASGKIGEGRTNASPQKKQPIKAPPKPISKDGKKGGGKQNGAADKQVNGIDVDGDDEPVPMMNGVHTTNGDTAPVDADASESNGATNESPEKTKPVSSTKGKGITTSGSTAENADTDADDTAAAGGAVKPAVLNGEGAMMSPESL
ncbi:Transcriptional activator spt7 [Cyphellophora attinorum]|uniref:SAGA complex subunit Spt7 n=1 Tax=Cyphellophora attinorum TaxID=1664694 RepID=A0A0N1H8A9_9EURO|nr:Transcriptional activator spt7 [Phialophora attinorum]KPI39524.1 Transcriptional activator spt7 [Phialophora attinorum]